MPKKLVHQYPEGYASFTLNQKKTWRKKNQFVPQDGQLTTDPTQQASSSAAQPTNEATDNDDDTAPAPQTEFSSLSISSAMDTISDPPIIGSETSAANAEDKKADSAAPAAPSPEFWDEELIKLTYDQLVNQCSLEELEAEYSPDGEQLAGTDALTGTKRQGWKKYQGRLKRAINSKKSVQGPSAEQPVSTPAEPQHVEEPLADQDTVAETSTPHPGGNPRNDSSASDQVPLAARASPTVNKRSLMTNHFAVDLGGLTTLYRYTFSDTIVKEPNPDNKLSEKQQGKLKEQSTNEQEKKPGARVRRRIYVLLLRQLKADGFQVASDYNKQIVSTNKIPDFGPEHEEKVLFFDEDRFPDQAGLPSFTLKVSSLTEINVQAVELHLKKLAPLPAAEAQGQIDAAVEALNILFSHHANQETVRYAYRAGDLASKEPRITFVGAKKFYEVPSRRLPPGAAQTEMNLKKAIDEGASSPWELSVPMADKGLMAAIGCFRSIKPVMGQGFLLNVNAVTGCFFKNLRLDCLINEYCTSRHSPSWKKVEKFISGLRVQTTYMVNDSHLKQIAGKDKKTVHERIYTISGLPQVYKNGYESLTEDLPWPEMVKFTPKSADGKEKETTIGEYWTSVKGQSLPKYEIIVRVGDGERAMFFPASYLEVLPGQNVRGKVDIVKEACRLPVPNFNYIQGDARRILGIEGNAQEGQKIAQYFGPIVGRTPEVVDAYSLPKPTVLFKEEKHSIMLTKTQVSWNLSNAKFLSTQPFKYAAIQIKNKESKRSFEYGKFYDLNSKMKDDLPKYGLSGEEVDVPKGGWQKGGDPNWDGHHCVKVEKPKGPLAKLEDQRKADDQADDANADAIRKKLGNLKSVQKADLIFVYLADGYPQDARIYSMVKRIGDLEVGVPTICVTSGNGGFRKGVENLVANLLLKVNTKIGNDTVNHSLQSLEPDREPPRLLSQKTMIVGIDVTHAGAGAMKEAPSVAAMVVSRDSNFAQWPAVLTLNPVKEVLDRDGEKKPKANEQVTRVGEMLINRLDVWHKANNNTWPDEIVVYRDGLSEGQFDICQTGEIKNMKYHLTKKAREGKFTCPKLLVVCTVKRHQCRFRGANKSLPVVDSSFNASSGTVVCDKITYGEGKDFFLMSQNAAHGTGRPTHYIVLHNEIPDLSIHDIANATYTLCFLWCRSTTVIGLVPPSKYADAACTRARAYMHYFYNGWSGSPVVYSGLKETKLGKKSHMHKVLTNIDPHKDVEDRMLYI